MRGVRPQGADRAVVAPLAALLATFVVAMATAATSGLALCRHEVALAMPMPMPMPMAMPTPTIDLCPLVIGLIVFATSLALWAAASLALERHRAVVRHRLLGMLAGLPIARASVGLAAVGALPIILVIVYDDGAPSSLEIWLLLVALIFGGSVLATLATVAAARIALGLGRRLVLRLARRVPTRPRIRPFGLPRRERVSPASAYGDVSVLASGLGLRAPPLHAR